MNSTVDSWNGPPTTVAFPPADVVQELYSVNFNIVASSALLFWDAALTFDRGTSGTKLSTINVLFLITRFLAIAGQMVFLVLYLGTSEVTESFCRGLVWFQGMLGLVMFILADVLLISRLYAFYGRNKVLLVSLGILELVAFGGVMGLGSVGFPKFLTTPNPVPHALHVGVCIPLGYPHIEPDLWLPLLAIQTILFGLAVGRHVYLQQNNSTRLGSALVTSNLYQVFIRDGVWVFFVLFLDLLLCVIGNGLQIILGGIAIQWCYAAIGVCISRLILNLRSANEQPQVHLPPAIVHNSLNNKILFLQEKQSYTSDTINSSEEPEFHV